MNNIKNIFTPGEGYCEYNQDQIKLMREKMFNNLANINSESKSSCPSNILPCKGGRSDEEEGDYIL